ncbi:MAG TPA: ATP-binding cassette domain-containing protein [Kofleriaceae bacterium]|nr:ATP-binding cassette domain-containing protein [Kofleriaceae bacterium]
MSNSAIELDHVTIRREGRLVVDDASLEINAGTIHVVIGPNGAGKSTLLTAMLGQTAFAGEIRMYFRRGGVIGYVPQSFVADRTLPITIAEFLALSRQSWPVCLGVRPHARSRITAILAKVGLAGMERRRLGELSGGELRRVLIGNAIDPAPELLLCDEPATGLDPDAIAQLDSLLCALRDDHGTTVVMVSHDRAQVRRVANRVTLLDVKIKDSGQPAKVLERAGAALDAVAP